MAATTMASVLGHLKRLSDPYSRLAMTDRELLDCWRRDRDEAAFAAIVQRHGAMVASICRRVLRDHHAGEDAFQATFLVLARKAGSVRDPQRLAGWLAQ